MASVWLFVLCAALAIVAYAYAVYPALLKVLGFLRRRPLVTAPPATWPAISITVPVYNEESVIRATIESIEEVDYPPERRQIIVISDASSDGTDAIVSEFAARGVELIRLPDRGGKTAAENAARSHLSGEIVINTDASVRIRPDAIKRLVASFTDPSVGVASGRDVSVKRSACDANLGESQYVGYEMWVRDLETRVYGIVGASGCLYAIRKHLHMETVPEALSRDFAAPLVAREHGFRSVSVRDAICFVPRASSLHREYRRKVRTMTRGLGTLFHKRHLLNPVRYGWFAWMLFSHKLARWLVPWALLVGAVAAAGLASAWVWAWFLIGPTLLVCSAGLVGWLWPTSRDVPRFAVLPAYVVSGVVAGLHAWLKTLRGELNPIWEPTRRKED